MSNLDFLFVNGVVSPPSQTLPVATLLESHPGSFFSLHIIIYLSIYLSLYNNLIY